MGSATSCVALASLRCSSTQDMYCTGGKPPKSRILKPQQRARLAFEQLGPTFVKLGQMLSTREDLLPPAWTD